MILVGTDFSPKSKKALDSAVFIAKQTNDKVCVVHISEELERSEQMKGFLESTHQLESYQKATKDGLETMMENFTAPYGDVITLAEVKFGVLLKSFQEYLDKTSPKLVVIGAHGHGFIHDLFIGNFLNKMLRTTKTPLLIVKESISKINKVLFCSSLDKNSSLFIEKFNSLELVPTSSLELAHVIEANPVFYFDLQKIPVFSNINSIEQLAEKKKEYAHAEIEKLGKKFETKDTHILSDMSYHITSTLNKFCNDNDFDIVVCAKTNKTKIDEFFVGSVSTEIVKSIDKSVLILPEVG